jgi:Cysteine rich repeat
MSKLHAAVLFVATGICSAASAQALTSEQRTACQADFDKYCKGTVPGGGRIIACLNKQRDQISDACRKVVDAQKK